MEGGVQEESEEPGVGPSRVGRGQSHPGGCWGLVRF